VTTSEALAAAKRDARALLRIRLRDLPPADFAAAGEAVALALMPRIAALPPSTVALFASRDDELDARPIERVLREHGHAVAVPRIDGHHLVFHVVARIHALPWDRFSIPTPPDTLPTVALSSCGLVLVPGLGFDVDGDRLGHGRGYYDRALADVDLDRAVGILMDEQWLPTVPTGEYDVGLRWLCSPSTGLVGAS